MQLVLVTGLRVHAVMLEGWSCSWSRIFKALYFRQTAV